MLDSHRDQKKTRTKSKTNRVEAYYVAAFHVPVGDGTFTEVIMRDVYSDNPVMFPPSRVEHRPNALSYLLCRCRQIEEEQGVSWRLLQLDGEGIHELGIGPYQEYLN